MGVSCPNCQHEHTRRGGRAIWVVYLLLIAAGIVAVFLADLHAGYVAAIMVVVASLANLVIRQRVCPACGHQWRP